jgi:hypothetical protein
MMQARAVRMVDLFDQYQAQHSIDRLLAQPPQSLTTRQYMVVNNIQCDSIGNNLGATLHGIVLAVLLNRTAVVRENNHCHGLLAYQAWVPTQSALEVHLGEDASPSLLHAWAHPASPPYACYVDRANQTALHFAALQNRAFDHFNNISGVRLGAETRARRDAMFSCPVRMYSPASGVRHTHIHTPLCLVPCSHLVCIPPAPVLRFSRCLRTGGGRCTALPCIGSSKRPRR